MFKTEQTFHEIVIKPEEDLEEDLEYIYIYIKPVGLNSISCVQNHLDFELTKLLGMVLSASNFLKF